jgi:hypothetical protein
MSDTLPHHNDIVAYTSNQVAAIVAAAVAAERERIRAHLMELLDLIK